jgi:hypothetical protein
MDRERCSRSMAKQLRAFNYRRELESPASWSASAAPEITLALPGLLDDEWANSALRANRDQIVECFHAVM